MKTFYIVKNIREKIPALITHDKQEATEFATNKNEANPTTRGWIVFPATASDLMTKASQYEDLSQKYLGAAEAVYLALQEAGEPVHAN